MSEPLNNETPKHWKLSIGCWRGTVNSRDSEVKTVMPGEDACPLSSLEDCKEATNYWRQSWARIGYSVWFAEAIDPEGVKHDIN